VINCEFNWWNSYLGFDVMFGYVNLMIIKLLMIKLHAQDVYICILCWLCAIWWKMMLWLLNDGEIMIIWCSCCGVMMFSSIYALGVDESIVVIELLWFCNFCENGLIMRKFDLMMLNELRRLLVWIRMTWFSVLIIWSWREIFWGENGFLSESRFKSFCQISHFGMSLIKLF